MNLLLFAVSWKPEKLIRQYEELAETTNQKINETIMAVAIAQVLQEIGPQTLPTEKFNELTTQKSNSIREVAKTKLQGAAQLGEAPAAGFAQGPRDEFERCMNGLTDQIVNLIREKDEMENNVKFLKVIKNLADEMAKLSDTLGEERERVEQEWRQMWFLERWFFTCVIAILKGWVWIGILHR